MAYNVVLFSNAERNFDALPKKEMVRIGEALQTLSDLASDLKHVKKLRLPLQGYRKRVGNYRILFDIENTTIFVHAIKHRKDAYR